MLHGGLDLPRAYAHVSTRRDCLCINPGFLTQLSLLDDMLAPSTRQRALAEYRWVAKQAVDGSNLHPAVHPSRLLAEEKGQQRDLCFFYSEACGMNRTCECRLYVAAILLSGEGDKGTQPGEV
jgi:hypothetical protein